MHNIFLACITKWHWSRSRYSKALELYERAAELEQGYTKAYSNSKVYTFYENVSEKIGVKKRL